MRRVILGAVGTRWSSTNRNGDVETFTDLHGRPTTHRPHIHTIFHGGGTGRVTVVATSRTGDHPFRVELRNADGNAVRDAQRDLARKLEARDRLEHQRGRERTRESQRDR